MQITEQLWVQNGTILRTVNGGTIWNSQSSGTANNLNGVSFTDADNGTAVGVAGTILRTTNGGTTWTAQSMGVNRNWNGVSFSDGNFGTAWCRYADIAEIYRTSNGGTTWTLSTSVNTYLSDLPSVSFSDQNNGIAIGYCFHSPLYEYRGFILRTTNGGTTWTSQSSVPFFVWCLIYQCKYRDDCGLYMAQSSEPQTAEQTGLYNQAATPNTLTGVSFTDANNGMAVGGYVDVLFDVTSGIIFRTTNGGTNWISQWDPTIYYLFSVCFVRMQIQGRL